MNANRHWLNFRGMKGVKQVARMTCESVTHIIIDLWHSVIEMILRKIGVLVMIESSLIIINLPGGE